MRLTTSVAPLAAGLLLAGAALVAVAAPASANDEGTLLDGGIYWFNAVGPLAEQSAATQITSGANATNRPWKTLTTQNACPAEAVQAYSYVRIPQTGVPENDWPQIPLGGAITTEDADGRFYSTLTSQADRLNKPEVIAYNTANGGSGTFPFVVVCRDAGGFPLGYFRTTVDIAGTTVEGLTWSIVSPTFTGGGPQVVATATSLTGAASGADLVLTAAVTPAAAGTVTFTEGATTLGTASVSGGQASVTVTAPPQGAHTYTAAFEPADPAAYGASTGTFTVTLGLDAATGELVLTVPEAPVVDGALTFSVPFDTPVALAGSRSGDNTRVTATGAFPTVTVTDTRRDGLLSHWQVNAQASDFTGTGGTTGTVGAKYLGWNPTSSAVPEAGSPLVTKNGAAVASFLDDTGSAGLSVSATLGESATAGRGVATLEAALNLAIPGTTAQGTYSSTVTVTLISD